jgi:predicted lipoprotein
MRRLVIFLCLTLFICAAEAAQQPAIPTKTPVVKAVAPELATELADAASAVNDRMRDLQATPQYQALNAAQEHQNAVYFRICAEIGVPPTAKPVFDERTKKLTGLQYVPAETK